MSSMWEHLRKPGDLINGASKPFGTNGHIPVPWDKGFFKPTPEWDGNTSVRSHDRVWS